MWKIPSVPSTPSRFRRQVWDRPLFTLEQFAKHAGEQVKTGLRSPFEGRRNFQGLLKGVEEQDVIVQADEHEYLLPVDSIEKANIIPRFD